MHLKEHVNGYTVPSGDPILIWSGQKVEVVHDFYFSLTVLYQGQLVYFTYLNQDKLHLLPSLHLQGNSSTLLEQLRYVYDPELSMVNIVDLGLVYEVDLREDEARVVMTLTSHYCGMGPALRENIVELLSLFNNVKKVSVDFTFTPKWNKDMISDSAQLKLGLL